MAVLKTIVSLYRAGEEKPIERYKTRVKVAEENRLFSSFQKNIIELLGLNEQALKFGLGSSDLKFYRLKKINKQALLEIEKMSENNTMPPELLLLTPLPDVVHIGKSLECSWSNWFIDLNGQMSSLVLICTLRDSTDSDVRKLLRKMLNLECVRNKDRMAVEPIQ